MGAQRVRTFIRMSVCCISSRRLHAAYFMTNFAQSCFFLLSGRLADLYGRKLVFVIGSAWMCIFGLACGFARSANQLLVLRALQGIGGAASITASVSVASQRLDFRFISAF
jgi:MFS family permease